MTKIHARRDRAVTNYRFPLLYKEIQRFQFSAATRPFVRES
jgi:hypothetical protein